MHHILHHWFMLSRSTRCPHVLNYMSQIFTQAITPAGTLLAQMPSAREIHTLKPFDVPVLDNLTLNTMRAPPDRSDDYGDENSSDEETVVASRQAPGAYPGSVSSYY